MLYKLMHKNEMFGMAEISDNGVMEKYNISNKELAPLESSYESNGFKKWWENRSVPISQNGLRDILDKNGYETSQEYLVKNLGLSLTDCYWIRPVDSDLQWNKINLFTNDFSTNMEHLDIPKKDTLGTGYTPNSSVQGQLEKYWFIYNDERYLFKGNHGNSSLESINEVFASKLHQKQKFDNYTNYKLLHVFEKEYEYGCVSKAFTSEKLELVSAYSVVTSQKQPNDISTYEFFIKLCAEYGLDESKLRNDLDYQIMTDFLISNTDRHLNNIAILRDTDTLKFVQMAPIFDSGKSMFVGSYIPQTEKEMLSIGIESFAKTELKMLQYVLDRKAVDVSLLPDKKLLEQAYSYESNVSEKYINKLYEAFEKKADLLWDFQLGKDLNRIKFPIRQKDTEWEL